jgi:hypothetical protein
MSVGTAARLHEVETLAIHDFHLKIVAPNSPESVLQVLVSSAPHPRISVDRVENMILDRSGLPHQVGLVVKRVRWSEDW